MEGAAAFSAAATASPVICQLAKCRLEEDGRGAFERWSGRPSKRNQRQGKSTTSQVRMKVAPVVNEHWKARKGSRAISGRHND